MGTTGGGINRDTLFELTREGIALGVFAGSSLDGALGDGNGRLYTVLKGGDGVTFIHRDDRPLSDAFDFLINKLLIVRIHALTPFVCGNVLGIANSV